MPTDDTHRNVINRCGFCGETFKIDPTDPHWSMGRGPLCPNRRPDGVIAQTTDDLLPTARDHVINRFARCREHNTIRVHAEEPCWKCWTERNRPAGTA